MLTRAKLLEMYMEQLIEYIHRPLTDKEIKCLYDWYLTRYYEEMEVMVNDHVTSFIEREIEE